MPLEAGKASLLPGFRPWRGGVPEVLTRRRRGLNLQSVRDRDLVVDWFEEPKRAVATADPESLGERPTASPR